MVPVVMIDFTYNTVEVDLSYGNGDTSEYDFDEVEIMQFTGLKDKNGKDIYEGDIVKTFNGTNAEIKNGEFQDDEALDRDEDFYLDCDKEQRMHVGFHTKDEDGSCNSLDNMTYKWVEIIDNIYENPELLEVTR